MLAMSYDAALRREEVCSLETTDVDPAHRLLRIRSEATKSRRERVVPYSAPTSEIFGQYLRVRRELSRERGRLFLSESLDSRASGNLSAIKLPRGERLDLMLWSLWSRNRGEAAQGVYSLEVERGKERESTNSYIRRRVLN